MNYSPLLTSNSPAYNTALWSVSYSVSMRRNTAPLKKSADMIVGLWTKSDLRNNVLLLFILFYGMYFGFFVGLPLALDISYVAATIWLMILGVLGLIAVLKIIMLGIIETRNVAVWIYTKVKDSLQSSGWKVQSAHS